MTTKLNYFSEISTIIKKIINEGESDDFEKRKDFAVNYIYEFYDKNKKFIPLAEPEITDSAGSVSWFQWVAYGDKNYQIFFYFSYLLDKKPKITIELLDEDDYSFVKKIR